MRRSDIGVPVAPERPRPLVVGEDEHKIRILGSRRRRGDDLRPSRDKNRQTNHRPSTNAVQPRVPARRAEPRIAADEIVTRAQSLLRHDALNDEYG
jgi:hypothetical protein